MIHNKKPVQKYTFFYCNFYYYLINQRFIHIYRLFITNTFIKTYRYLTHARRDNIKFSGAAKK